MLSCRGRCTSWCTQEHNPDVGAALDRLHRAKVDPFAPALRRFLAHSSFPCSICMLFLSLSLFTAQSSHSSCLCLVLTSGENHLLLLSMMCCLCAANFLVNAEIWPIAGSSAHLLQDADKSIIFISMQTPRNWVLYTVKFTAAFILLSSHESTWRRASTFSDSQNETGSLHPWARWE